MKFKFTFPFLLILSMMFSARSFAQVAPTAEPVYGGYVEDITAIPLTSTATRVYIATRSPNSLFYTDISNVTVSPTFSSFQVVPDFSVSANMGYIKEIDADENSQYVYAAMEDGGLYGASVVAGSIGLIDSNHIEALKVYDGHIFYLRMTSGDLRIYEGTIDAATGAVTVNGSVVVIASPADWPPRFKPQIHINENTHYIYVFIPGQPPAIYKSSTTYDTMSSSTTFSTIPINDLISAGHDYCAMGIAPDNKIYLAAYEGNSADFDAWFSVSSSDGDPWTTTSVSLDIGRGEFAIKGTPSDYYVYYSRVYSDDKGLNWHYHGTADGAISADPNDVAISYGRSDWAMYMVNRHFGTITDINEGIQAVQVEAIGMNSGKTKAWIASKSGIWYVEDYGTSSPTWVTHPIWPNGDSMPFVSAVSNRDGNIAYMGNVGGNLYRYETSSGDVDDVSNYDLIFDARSLSTWTYGVMVKSIAIDHAYSGERIFIGLYDCEDWDETTPTQGGVFVGENISGSWTWAQITDTSVLPDGIDVNNMISVTEGGNTVVYVGADYNDDFATVVSGIYRMEEIAPGNWTVTQDLFTSSGTLIESNILDIAKSPTNVIYACGYVPSTSSPLIVYKSVGGTYWTELTTSGLPSSDYQIKSITFHNNDVYVAVGNEIYELPSGASSWSLYYSYPVGTEINFIYYDDLLVGTEYGLFVHNENANDIGRDENSPNKFELKQNYPNPFNPTTTISYSLPEIKNAETSHTVSLEIFNILGQKVATLVNNKEQSPANYSVQFNAANLPSGIYFYSLKAGNFRATRKMILMK